MNQFTSKFDNSPSFGIEIVSKSPSLGLLLISSYSSVDDWDSDVSDLTDSTRI